MTLANELKCVNLQALSPGWPRWLWGKEGAEEGRRDETCDIHSVSASARWGRGAERFADPWPLPKDRDWHDTNKADKSERQDGSEANKVTSGPTAQDLDGKRAAQYLARR